MYSPDSLPFLFIQNKTIEIGNIIKIDSDNTHYLLRVLRLRKDDSITLFNNTIYLYKAKIINTNKKEAELMILDKKKSSSEATVSITLLQGIPKKERFEWIIQKTTELGIHSITPISSEHSIKKIDTNKINRLQKIAIEAARQSKRSSTSFVNQALTLNEYFKTSSNKNALKLLLSQDGNNTLKDTLQKFKGNEIIIAIGPEGDFSNHEKEIFLKNGFIKISLGDRILRTETAAIIATGIIQYETKNI